MWQIQEVKKNQFVTLSVGRYLSSASLKRSLRKYSAVSSSWYSLAKARQVWVPGSSHNLFNQIEFAFFEKKNHISKNENESIDIRRRLFVARYNPLIFTSSLVWPSQWWAPPDLPAGLHFFLPCSCCRRRLRPPRRVESWSRCRWGCAGGTRSGRTGAQGWRIWYPVKNVLIVQRFSWTFLYWKIPFVIILRQIIIRLRFL